MLPTISYLIASFRTEALNKTLESIGRLPAHSYEIVVCHPNPKESPYYEDSHIIFVQDDRHDGSTYAFNKGVQYCLGEWVVVGIDDHVVNYDVEKFLNLIQTPEMKAREYQVINLGAPWTDCLDRNIRSHGLSVSIPNELRGNRWPVITFPAVSQKTIVEKFNRHLFHPDLLHHFVDHWIGLYCSTKQPNYDFNQLGNGPYWTQHWPGENCVRTYDDHDSKMFCELAAKFIQDPSRGYIQPL